MAILWGLRPPQTKEISMAKRDEVVINDVDEEPESDDSSPVGYIERIKFKANINKGNYETETVELEYVLAEEENPEEAFKYLRDTALYYLENAEN
jgi:hypothetical protein